LGAQSAFTVTEVPFRIGFIRTSEAHMSGAFSIILYIQMHLLVVQLPLKYLGENCEMPRLAFKFYSTIASNDVSSC